VLEPDPAALHAPVLLAEVLTHLAVQPGQRVLDCTLGLGGHAQALLAAGARVVGVDRDPRARELAAQRLAAAGDRLDIRSGTFADTVAEALDAGERYDAVLADLGVSSLQLDDVGRGFGMRSDAAPDMRMGDDGAPTALELIASLDETELADIIWRYGEDRLSRRIARAIKRAEAEGRLASAVDLADVVRRAVPGHHPRHPAQRTFQALRIAVNDELGQLASLLAALPRLLAGGGRAVVISFHSLEDRAVKVAFRAHRDAGDFTAIARSPVIAGESELAANRRSGSAKLRWARGRDQPPGAPHA